MDNDIKFDSNLLGILIAFLIFEFSLNVFNKFAEFSDQKYYISNKNAFQWDVYRPLVDRILA